MGYSKTYSIGRSFSTSNNLINKVESERTISWSTYTKTREFTVIGEIYPTSSFKATVDIMATSGTTYAKIYYNGVAHTAEATENGAYSTKTWDPLNFTTLKVNDTLELWTYNTDSNGKAKNFYLYGTESPLYPSI